MDMTRRKFLALASFGAAVAVQPGLMRGMREAMAAETDSLGEYDAVELAKLLRKGALAPVDVLDAAIARIERLNPSVNAVVTKAYDLARNAVESNVFGEPFAGVPTLIKDLNDVRGIRTTSGCRRMMDNTAKSHHPYAKAMIDAGFNVVGKSNTPEFGLQATTESLALGPCYNPWDLTRSAGGSSGGAGAAVASGMVPLAHGNDGGGSIRIPASCCGVFGLKSSRGRLVGSTNMWGLGVEGGLSRSVRDSAHLLAHTERDKPAPGMKPVGLVTGPSKRRLKIGLCLTGAKGEQPAPDVAHAIYETAILCQQLGHDVREAELKFDGHRMVDEFLTLWSSAGGIVRKQMEAALDREVTPQDLEPLTIGFADQYDAGGAERMGEATQFLRALAADVNAQVSSYDVMLSPVLRTAPPRIGEQGPTVPFDILIPRMIEYVAYTPLHNVTGMPAMSVPLHWNDDGLPIGSQFAANVGDEETLLQLAYELEEASPWKDRRPSVAGA